jgi:hypothetical protein
MEIISTPIDLPLGPALVDGYVIPESVMNIRAKWRNNLIRVFGLSWAHAKRADVSIRLRQSQIISRIRRRTHIPRESKSRYTSLGNDARSIVLARNNLAFVAATEIPRAWAISFVEYSFA